MRFRWSRHLVNSLQRNQGRTVWRYDIGYWFPERRSSISQATMDARIAKLVELGYLERSDATKGYVVTTKALPTLRAPKARAPRPNTSKFPWTVQDHWQHLQSVGGRAAFAVAMQLQNKRDTVQTRRVLPHLQHGWLIRSLTELRKARSWLARLYAGGPLSTTEQIPAGIGYLAVTNHGCQLLMWDLAVTWDATTGRFVEADTVECHQKVKAFMLALV